MITLIEHKLMPLIRLKISPLDLFFNFTCSLIGEVLVVSQDVASTPSLPSSAHLIPHLRQNCGKCENVGTATFRKTVVGG